MTAIGQAELLPKEKVLPSVGLFLALLALFSSVGYYLTIEITLIRYYIVVLMWSPGLAALATCRIMGISLASIGWGWGESRWQWMAYFIPVLYGLIAFGFVWGFGLAGAAGPKYIAGVSDYLGLHGWSPAAVITFAVVMFGGVGMVWRIASSLGEEIGWRGFLTPQLMRVFSFPVTSVIVGLVWSLWHAPLIYFTKYNGGPYDLHLQMVNFTIMTIGISFVMTYLRLKSGSVWSATIMHAAHNCFVIGLFSEMTINYEGRLYAGEFGSVLPVVMVLFAAFFWYRARKEGLSGPLNQ
jgi:membrane protease YdiL (CAAX protease family)